MSKIPTVALYANKEEIKDAFQILHNPHMCIRCNKAFDLASNIGMHGCFQHPGHPENGRWSCCDNPVYNLFYSKHFKVDSMFSCSVNMPPYPPPVQTNGCQKCDHTICGKKWTFKDTQRLHEIAGLIPFINKKFPAENRTGFSVVKINGQKMPVFLRCARKWIFWPIVDEEAFDDIYLNSDNNNCIFRYIEINYISLGGEEIPLIYDKTQWENIDREKKWNSTDKKLDIRGDFISAFYVYQYAPTETGILEGDKVKKQIFDLI